MPDRNLKRHFRRTHLTLQMFTLMLCIHAHAGTNEWTGQPPQGGQVFGVWPAQGIPEKVWALGRDGLYVSTDAGAAWSQVQIDPGDGLVDNPGSLLPDPNDADRLKLMDFDRVLESTDGGNTWGVFSELGQPVGGTLLYGGTFSPVIYSWGRTGLSRSDDAGQTFTSLTALRPLSSAFDFVADPFDPLTVFIGGDGLYRSSDGGATWTMMTNGLPSGTVLAIAADPVNQDRFYVTIRNQGVFATTDGGDSWQFKSNEPASSATQLKVHPLAPSRLYLTTRFNDVFVSLNTGQTWSPLPNNGLFGFESEVLAFDTTNADRLYLGMTWKGIYTTANGGNDWRRRNDGFSSQPVYELAIGPADGRVYAGLRDGVATRAIDTDAWIENEGAYSLLVTAMAVDPLEPAHAYLGSSCCGIWQTFDAGINWSPVPGLTDDDITDLDIPESDPNTLWITDSSFGLFGTRNDAETFDNYSAGLAPLFTGTVNLYAVDAVANQPNTLYVGANEGIFLFGADEGDGGIYRSDDGGLTWTRKSGGTLDGPREVYHIAAHPGDADSLIVGAEQLYRSTDGGETWEVLAMPVSDYVASLYRSYDHPELFYAHDRFGVLYRSSDGGDTFETAPSDGGGGNSQAVHADPSNPARVYRAAFSSDFKEFTFATDVSVALSLPTSEFEPGQSATLSATVSNDGPWKATAARLNVDVPVGFEVGTVLTAQGSCAVGSGVECELGNLAVGANVSVLIELTAQANGGGDLTMTATAVEEELTAADNTGLLTLNIAGGADSDGDGVGDALDNCSLVPNAAQIDADADGYGNVCDADFNNDCVVNVVDLGQMRLAFFTTDAVVDMNADGVVNVLDLGLLRQGFFQGPGPSGITQNCGTRTGSKSLRP